MHVSDTQRVDEIKLVDKSDGFSAATSIKANGDFHATLESLPESFYLPFLSAKALRLKPSPIRYLLPLEKIPGMLSLLAGKPNPSTFPITSVSFTTRHPSGEQVPLSLDGDALEEALQYNMISGLPELVSWITDLQGISHGRHKREGWRVSMGVGSQDLIQKCFSALFDEKDTVLVETPAYPGVIPILQSMNLELIEIPCDANGLLPATMSSILDSWPKTKKKPKALYTIPVGSNPTGFTASLERRLEVLALARKHDLLILEDDPYYYLYYGNNPRPPSYFTLEATERGSPVGRVIRFDSLSKVLSSGFRLGFVSGPERILNAIDMQTAISNLQPSSFAQGVVLAILKSWGHDNFLMHTLNVSAFYKKKRDLFITAAERQLAGLAEWNIPDAGMFLWIKLNIPLNAEGEADSEKLIRESALEAGVLALPGVVAFPLGRKNEYCRISFSLSSAEDMEEACRRLASVIKETRTTVM